MREGENLETEVKFRLRDRTHAEEVVRFFEKITVPEYTFEKNLLFDTSGETLRKQGKIFRLRSSLGIDREQGLMKEGGKFELTVKSPTARDDTRNEFNVSLGIGHKDLPRIVRLLSLLGFEEVFFYEKLREDREISGVTVTVAELPLLGHWVEFEGGRVQIYRYAALLGFKRGDAITKDFRTLWEEHALTHNLPCYTRLTFSRKRRR